MKQHPISCMLHTNKKAYPKICFFRKTKTYNGCSSTIFQRPSTFLKFIVLLTRFGFPLTAIRFMLQTSHEVSATFLSL